MLLLNSDLDIFLVNLNAVSYEQRGIPHDVLVNMLDKLQLRYHVHIRTNTLEEGMNPLILLAMG